MVNMSIKLRDYQQETVDSTIAALKKSTAPIVIEAATGAGKSLIVAELAHWLSRVAPTKKILCFAPSKELIEQNAEKYLLTGNDASIFCSSAGEKCFKNQVVFCSPLTTKNAIDEIAQMEVCAIILDEAHTLTPTIISIINAIKANNPNVRIIGLSATCYRMGTGYIFAVDEWNEPVSETKAVNPFFSRLIYRITAPQLIKQGYLTPPKLIDAGVAYETAGLKKNSMGNFESSDLQAVFENSNITKLVIQHIISISDNHTGIMIFATTVKHANEILDMLPLGDCRLVTGETAKKEREEIVAMFKAKMIKFLVNVSCLTTGFDAPHVDLIAVLRPTESRGLFQQIIGRGTRLNEGKKYFYVLDVAGNIARHGLSADDLFTPEIPPIAEGKESHGEEVECPDCGFINENKIVEVKGKFISTLRRCANVTPKEGIENPVLSRHFVRCGYYFKSKECPTCSSDNDITARKCRKCGNELIDPNEKLEVGKKTDFSHKVESFVISEHISAAGNEGYKALINGKYTKYFATHTKWGFIEYQQVLRKQPDEIIVKTGGKFPKIQLVWKDDKN